jgi:hypothetical protein
MPPLADLTSPPRPRSPASRREEDAAASTLPRPARPRGCGAWLAVGRSVRRRRARLGLAGRGCRQPHGDSRDVIGWAGFQAVRWAFIGMSGRPDRPRVEESALGIFEYRLNRMPRPPTAFERLLAGSVAVSRKPRLEGFLRLAFKRKHERPDWRRHTEAMA